MGEYEPSDSRNITGTAQTEDGRWTAQAKQGQPNQEQQQGGRPTQGQQQTGQQQTGQQQTGQQQTGQQQAARQQFDQDVQFDGGSGSLQDVERQMHQSVSGGSQQGDQLSAGQIGGDQGSSQGFAEGFTAQEASQSGQQNQSNLGAGQMGGGQMGGGQMNQGEMSQGQLGGAVDQQRAPEQNMGGSQGVIGQQNDGVSDASNQNNDHTSGIGQEQQLDSQGLNSQGSSSGVLGQQGGATGTSRFNEQIAQHMEVVDQSGQHLGHVDSIEGDRIKLTRKDSPDGQHHYVELSQVQGIDGGQLRLSSGATSV